MACLVAVDLTRDVMGLHEDEVAHGVGGFLQRGSRWLDQRGSLALLGLVHVTLGGGVVDGDVSPDAVGS